MLGLLLLPLLAVCCFGPGFFLVRRFRLTTDEKISLSVGVSLILIYLASGVLLLSGVNWKACWLLTVIFLAMTAFSWRDLQRLLRRRQARRQLLAFGLIAILGALLLTLIQNYSGGSWSGDWKEHYQRTIFFLQRQPKYTRFIDDYILPARPPMMHLVGAYFLAHLGKAGLAYDAYQVVAMFLNAVVFLPCVLLAGMLVKYGNRRVWLIAAFIAGNAVFIQNLTWTWNKLMAAFFVILSLALYLRAWRKNSPGRLIAAAASMAAGFLVHYSPGPFVAFISLHYLAVLFMDWRRGRPRKLYEPFAALGAAGGLLATWFISSIVAYGVHDTFLSNTTASGTQVMTWSENLERVTFDLRSSTIPYPLRHGPQAFISLFDQPNAYGFVRDYYFLFCQQNLMGWYGLLGWAAVLYVMVRLFLRGESRLTIFWVSMITLTTILGIVVVGTFDDFGVAHACLLPLMLAGVTLLAAGFGMLRRWIRMTLAVAMVADILLGVVLHIRMEMLPIKRLVVRQSDVIPISPALLNVQGVANSVLRFQQKFVYLGDHLVPLSRWNLAIVLAAYAGVVYLIARAASSPLQTDRSKRTLLVSLYLFGAMICISDRLVGYDPPPIEKAIPITADSDPKVIEAYLARIDEQIKANPESAEAYYQRALAFYYLDRFPLAWEQDINALLLDPYHDKAHYLMALFRIAYKGVTNSKRDETGFLYQREIWDNARNYLSYGVDLFLRGFQRKGLEVLTDATRRFPDDPGTHEILARALNDANRGAEAVPAAEMALRLAPDDPGRAALLRTIMAGQGYDNARIEARIAQIIAEAKKPKP